MDYQGVVLLLVRRKRDFDEVWVRLRVFWDEVLDLLDRNVSFGL
jgi:hypothetical protein